MRLICGHYRLMDTLSINKDARHVPKDILKRLAKNPILICSYGYRSETSPYARNLHVLFFFSSSLPFTWFSIEKRKEKIWQLRSKQANALCLHI